MANDKENIGDIYQKAFQDAGWDDPEDEQDWNAIAFQLDKKRFFRFSWTRFNIYYSALIVLSFLFMIFLFVRNIVIEKENSDSRRNTPAVISDSLGSERNSIQTPDATQNNDAKKTSENVNVQKTNSYPGTQIPSGKNQINTADQNQSVNDNVSKTTDSTVTSSNSLNTKPDTSVLNKEKSVVVQNPAPKKPKKIVYITQQDTIKIVDTLRSKKLRNKQK
jgi:cytoskeletal protein RodZ